MAEKIYIDSRRVTDAAEDRRVPVPVNLTPAARGIIKQLRDDTGITQQAAVERILEWFGQQAPTVRDAILLRRGDPVAEMIRLRMADTTAASDVRAAASITFDQALHAARVMLDRMEQINEARAGELRGRGPTKKKHV